MLRRRSLLAAGGAILGTPHTTRAYEQERFEVDLALVLAADVSKSVSRERWELQKRGYAHAFRDQAIIERITAGEKGVTAVAFVQWSGPWQQVRSAGWHKIHNRVSAGLFADQIEEMGREYAFSTAIGPALVYCTEQFRWAPRAKQMVIDISGDGKQETGRLESAVSPAFGRNYALARGIIINALPIMWEVPIDGNEAQVETNNTDTLAEYRQVIGGPNCFYIVAHSPDDEEKFAQAVRRKLLREAST